MDSKNKTLASRAEEDMVSRRVMVWVNEFPDLPPDIYDGTILYEQLKDDTPCMALSAIQGTYITRRYITGGHQAEYQFKVIYRIKPGNSMDKRLKADELLDRFGDWASSDKPDLGENINVIRVEQNTRSALFGAYDNGDEDHQILMTLLYEVI